MSRWGSINNLTRSGEWVITARWCQSFLCKARGLTLRRKLGDEEGLLLVERSEGRINTSITMWFMFFPITVAWLDKEFRVVDVVLASPWHNYLPAVPAKYMLEGPTGMRDRLSVGDQLEWVDA